MRIIAAIFLAALLLALPASAQQPESPKRVALLIGIDRYNDQSVMQQVTVANVRNDLTLLKNSFEKTGYSTQLIDNPTARDLRERLRKFDLVARNAEIAVVYFTGMGIQVDGIDYVTGADAGFEEKRPEDLDLAGFVSIQELAVAVQSASKFSVVFAEAGRENPWPVAGPTRGFKIGPKITASEAASDASVLIFYGSQPGTASFDGPINGNGPFAAAVAKHIMQPGLEVGLFVRRVRADVSRATAGLQRPELLGELGEKEFYLSGSDEQAAQPLVPVFSPQPRLALVIGNSDYNRDGDLDDDSESRAVTEDRFPTDLANPRNDSEDIGLALRKLKFDVTIVQDADFSAMIEALFAFENKINSVSDSAIVVIYYAGHAIQVGGGNYLLPVGAKLPQSELERLPPAQAQALIEQVALPVQTRLLERLKTPNRDGLNLVILDACRENPWGKMVVTRGAGGRGGGAGQGTFRGLGEVRIDLRRTAIAFATKPGDVAADGAGRNSPYTAALVRLVPVPGVSVIELLNRVNGEVEVSTDGRQVPWFNTPAIGKTCLGACIPQD